MFTGIIEAMGEVLDITHEEENIHFKIKSPFLEELSIDQSVAHNGTCLTIVSIDDDAYTVTAIAETLRKTNLGSLKKGDRVNLERCLKLSDRIDGHVVQGHVDQVGTLEKVINEKGSYQLYFSYKENKYVTVEKGSICVNGVSLTVVESEKGTFSVAIIPYTWENTNLGSLKVGSPVNLEFDILGKYVQKLMKS